LQRARRAQPRDLASASLRKLRLAAYDSVVEPGRASETAILVCMGRAIADGRSAVRQFADPTAMALLPDAARARVERIRRTAIPWRLFEYAHLTNLATMMALRTNAIDDAVRGVTSPQVVILGAGLDGRAWRMPELAGAVVFEVDHPDSQRIKRARATALDRVAREVRFVAVDFTRDSLDAALAAAGHDPAQPTTWIWEGVVMYLAQPAIDATLAVIDRRSAPASRLVVAYHAPALILRVVGAVVRRMGEPLHSSFTPDAMRALLARYRFDVVRDASIASLGAAISRSVARATRFNTHLHIATADRR
jgi:methyltransferase (TIGR00027 family)